MESDEGLTMKCKVMKENKDAEYDEYEYDEYDGDFENNEYDEYENDRLTISSSSETQIKQVDFLVSFLVDARGGTMMGRRSSGLRLIIPPKTAPAPMRITVRYIQEENLLFSPPLNEGEGLACRILKIGPRKSEFLGPVLIEVPVLSSSKHRELFVLRCDNGRKWQAHVMDNLEKDKNDILSSSVLLESMTMSPEPNDPRTPLKNDSFSETPQIFQFTTSNFPQYFAIISRPQQDSKIVGPSEFTLIHRYDHRFFVRFPPKALSKDTFIALSVHHINNESKDKKTFSSILTIEPRRRKFHRAITISIPFPTSLTDPSSVILLSSMSGNYTKALWEPLTSSSLCLSSEGSFVFNSFVSASFWLITKSSSSSELMSFAESLYKRTIGVPYNARIHVYAKAHEIGNLVHLRILILTEEERSLCPLEIQEEFKEIVRSEYFEIVDRSEISVEFSGNLIGKKCDVLEVRRTFSPFSDNRQGFILQKKKESNSFCKGRISFVSKYSQKILFDSQLDVTSFL